MFVVAVCLSGVCLSLHILLYIYIFQRAARRRCDNERNRDESEESRAARPVICFMKTFTRRLVSRDQRCLKCVKRKLNIYERRTSSNIEMSLRKSRTDFFLLCGVRAARAEMQV